MGYYTRYTLKVMPIDKDGAEQALLAKVKEQVSYAESLGEMYKLLKDARKMTPEGIIAELRGTCQEAEYALTERGGTNDAVKWYDSNAHLREFSKKHPLFVFTLQGRGEEEDDIWVEYYMDGKCQKEPAVITMGAFDPSKLK